MRTIPLLAALCLFLASCDLTWLRPSNPGDPEAFSTYANPAMEDVRRLVVVPFFRDEAGNASKALDRAMPRSWRELNRFEVVELNTEERDEFFTTDVLRSNRIPSDTLRKVREMYNADAILIGRLEHFNGYDPIAVGATAHVMSCRDGRVLWSGSGQWDGGLHAIQDDIRNWWYDRIGSANERVGGWKTVLSSPRDFARYVSDRLAASVPVLKHPRG